MKPQKQTNLCGLKIFCWITLLPSASFATGCAKSSSRPHRMPVKPHTRCGMRLDFAILRRAISAGFSPSLDMVKLVFEWGVLLPNQRGVLQGNGKQTRFIELSSEPEIPLQAIDELIAAALGLPGDRKMRLWLVQNQAQPKSPHTSR